MARRPLLLRSSQSLSSLDGQDDDSDDSDDDGNLSDASGSYTETKDHVTSPQSGRSTLVTSSSDAARSTSCPSVSAGYTSPEHGRHSGKEKLNNSSIDLRVIRYLFIKYHIHERLIYNIGVCWRL